MACHSQSRRRGERGGNFEKRAPDPGIDPDARLHRNHPDEPCRQHQERDVEPEGHRDPRTGRNARERRADELAVSCAALQSWPLAASRPCCSTSDSRIVCAALLPSTSAEPSRNASPAGTQTARENREKESRQPVCRRDGADGHRALCHQRGETNEREKHKSVAEVGEPCRAEEQAILKIAPQARSELR